MSEPLSEHAAGVARAAWASASAAAQSAGIEMGLLLDASETRRTAELLAEVWAVTGGPMPISGDLIRALVHTGNYAAGAWWDTDLVGASVGFLALAGGRLSLHSHITGVARIARRSNVGFALKQHQRAWALSQGNPGGDVDLRPARSGQCPLQPGQARGGGGRLPRLISTARCRTGSTPATGAIAARSSGCSTTPRARPPAPVHPSKAMISAHWCQRRPSCWPSAPTTRRP